MTWDTSLTIIIPVYNDVKSLERALPLTIRHLEEINLPFEVIIAEDASSDGSYELALSYTETDSRIKLSHSSERRGKGGGISDAIKMSTGDIVCFYDVDLATDLSSLPELIKTVIEDSDIAIGSRNHPKSHVNRANSRNITSKLFLCLARTLLGKAVTDYQCGFKAFKKSCLDVLLPRTRTRGWTWDSEILALAQKHGYTIKEIPVIWFESNQTTLRFKDMFIMGWEIVALSWRLHVEKS